MYKVEHFSMVWATDRPLPGMRMAATLGQLADTVGKTSGALGAVLFLKKCELC